MKRKMRPGAFAQVRKDIGQNTAYFALRRAVRSTPQFRANAGGLMIVVVDKHWITRFQRAAELLFTSRWRPVHAVEASRRLVVVFEAGSKKKIDIDWLSPQHQTVVLTDDPKALPKRVRLAADVTIFVEKPTAQHLMAVRKLARRPPIDLETAEELAKQSWDIIAALIGRQSLSKSDLSTLVAAENEGHRGARLRELAGYGAAHQWADELATDLALWRAGELSWSDVDKAALLTGPPGTGKTFFAHALAAELGIPLIVTSVGEWQSAGDGHLGDMLRAMRESFAEARSKTFAVLFIDELDSIGNRAHMSQYQYYEFKRCQHFPGAVRRVG